MKPRTAIASIAALTVTVSLGSVVLATSAQGAIQRNTGATLVNDQMSRLVSGGLGRAIVGGPYTVSPATAARVDGSVAHLSLKPGRSATATLGSVYAGEIDASVDLALKTVPATSGSIYSAVRARDFQGHNYAARLKVDPGGVTTLGIVREDGSPGAITTLGSRVTLRGRLVAGAKMSVELQITGTSPVQLQARAWPVGTAVPAWSVQYADSSASRITHTGAMSLWAYASGAALATEVLADNLTAHSLLIAVGNPIPAPVTPTPTPPPSSSAPGVPPTTSPAPPVSVTPTPTPTPAPVGSTDGPGAAPLGSTRYAIPTNSLFVAPSGSDTATGTVSAPMRTLAAALSRSLAGQTIVLRGGVYHEAVTVPDSRHNLTIQSYPGETVWFDGSTEVTGWAASNGTWAKSGWTPKFDSSSSFTRGSDDPTFIDPNYPMAAHPDQVWIDGVAQAQVSALSEVTPGSFYVDYAYSRLYLGTNPAGHEVRASDLGRAFVSNALTTTLRGIGFHRFAPSLPDMGTVRLGGANSVVDNLLVSDNSATGVSVGGTGQTVENTTIVRNGLLGLHANYADQLTVAGNKVDYNNSGHFNRNPVSGGVKITRSRGVTLRGNEVSFNVTNGVWLDESVYNGVLVNNTVSHNGCHGIETEISAKMVLAGNVVVGNGLNGIFVLDTNQVQVWNNTLVGNWRQFNAYQDTRDPALPGAVGRDPRQPQPDLTMTWKAGQISFKNNVLVNQARDDWMFLVQDGTRSRTAAQMGVAMDSNVYERGAAGVAMLSTGTGNAGYSGLPALRSATGLEATGTEVAQGLTAIVAATLSAHSTPLPADLAGFLGVPVGTAHSGAFIAIAS